MFGIKFKLLSILVVMFAISVANIVLMYWHMDRQKQNSNVVNVAGNQRMIGQKIVNLAYSINRGADQHRSKLRKTLARYKNSRNILLNEFKKIELFTDKYVGRKNALFAENRSIWRDYERNASIVAGHSRDDPFFSESVSHLIENNENLLNVDIKITNLLGLIYETNIRQLITQLFLVLVSELIVFVLGVALLTNFVKPLKKLSNIAVAVGKGDLNHHAVESTGDEMGELAMAFNEMISQLARSREESLETQKITDNILNSMTDPLLILDLDGAIVRANSATTDLLGFDKDQLYGEHLQVIHKGSELVEEGTEFHKLIQVGDIGYLRTSDGEKIPVSMKTSMVKSTDGKISGVVCIARDIRDIKGLFSDLSNAKEQLEQLSQTLEKRVIERTEELENAKDTILKMVHSLEMESASLRESEQQQRDLLNNTSSIIFIKTMEGKYVFVNRVFEKVYGVRNSELVGHCDESIYQTETINKYRKLESECLTQKNPLEFEETIKQNGVECSYISIRFPLYSVSGEAYAICGMSTDITHRKHSEDAIRKLNDDLEDRVKDRTKELIVAKKHADEASQAKSAFLANMSHEIRTPMNAILGFSEMLKDMETDLKKRHYAESIFSSGSSLLSLINDILDLSKIETGKMSLHNSEFSLSGLFDELYVLFANTAKDKNLGFEIVPNNIPFSLNFDELRIRQVLVNLLSNAFKFTHKGSVKVTASWVDTIVNSNSSGCLNISVSDSGIGIPADQQNSIFESFEQVAGQSEKLYGGTGLGLAITKRIVELMNGTISVESTEGAGTCFSLTIPNIRSNQISQKSSNRTLGQDATHTVFAPATILIVDDVDYNQEVLAAFISDMGFTIHLADNGEEAIGKVKRILPDIVLLDMEMPVMNGYQAASIIKGNDATSSIPIIAVTASASKDAEESIRILCDSFLSKPITKSALISELKNYLPHEVLANEEADLPQTIDDLPMVTPSLEILQKLHDAAMTGIMDDVADLSITIVQQDGSFGSFVEKLKSMAEAYEDERMLVFLEKCILDRKS